MTQFENQKNNLQIFEDNLTLKTDYTEELEMLKGYEGNLPVFRYLGVPVWAIQDQKKKIENIRNWIKEEISYNSKS